MPPTGLDRRGLYARFFSEGHGIRRSVVGCFHSCCCADWAIIRSGFRLCGHTRYQNRADRGSGLLQLLKLVVDICLLRAGPQDLPASSTLPVLAALGYFLSSLLLFLVDARLPSALSAAGADTALLCGFTWGILQVRHYPERFKQTLSALAGTGTLLGLCALPLMEVIVRAQAQGADAGGALFGWLAMLLWSFAVFGHIVRHALSVPLSFGIGLGVLFAVISVAIIRALIPEVAGGT